MGAQCRELALGRPQAQEQELWREREPGFELAAEPPPGPGADAPYLQPFRRCCLPPKPTAVQPLDRP